MYKKYTTHIAGYISIPIYINHYYKEELIMKKFKKLLLVTGLLMALGVVIPAVQSNANSDYTIEVASNWPPADSFGII